MGISRTKVDVVIIGAGVVGLAVAEALSRTHPGQSIVVLERHSKFGQEASSHNSEVIHAGIYYNGLPIKQRTCIRGRELLYDFCRKWNIPHRICGKLIVTSAPEQIKTIETLAVRAKDLGVPMERLSASETQKKLGHPTIGEALWSSTSGIVDTHDFMNRLEALATNQGVLLMYSHVVKRCSVEDLGGVLIEAVDSSGKALLIEAQSLINAAGLGSDRIAKQLNPDWNVEIRPCRGRYFSLSAKWSGKFSFLCYPVPDPKGGLGIHLTVDMGGKCKLGPDVDWDSGRGIRADDSLLYRFGGVDEKRSNNFYEAGSKYLHGLRIEDLIPDYIGVRPKLFENGDLIKDFMIRKGESGRDIHLLGIESPGVTSALALAEEICAI